MKSGVINIGTYLYHINTTQQFKGSLTLHAQLGHDGVDKGESRAPLLPGCDQRRVTAPGDLATVGVALHVADIVLSV